MMPVERDTLCLEKVLEFFVIVEFFTRTTISAYETVYDHIYLHV